MTAHTARRVDDRVRLLKTARFYCIFKFKGIMLTLVQSSSLKAQFAGTLASPQTSVGVRLSRIHFSPHFSVGEK